MTIRAHYTLFRHLTTARHPVASSIHKIFEGTLESYLQPTFIAGKRKITWQGRRSIQWRGQHVGDWKFIAVNLNPIETMIYFLVDWPAHYQGSVSRSAGTAAGTNDNACCEQSNDREKIAMYFWSNSSVHALFPGAATFQINQICSEMCARQRERRGRK